MQIAQRADAVLTLLRVVPPVSAPAAPHGSQPHLDSCEEGRVHGAKEYLRRIRQGLPGNLHVQCIVLIGNEVSETLERFAEITGVDLFVMSTHGEGGLRRIALGSTADQIVRDAFPAIVVRPDRSARLTSAANAISALQRANLWVAAG